MSSRLPPPSLVQEQRVSDLQEEARLPAFAAQRLELRRADLEDLPEPGRVRGPPAPRPGATQQAAQQGGAELEHRGGAPTASPLQVREVGEERGALQLNTTAGRLDDSRLID